MAFQLIKSLVWSVNTATKLPAPVQFAPCNNNLASCVILLLISLLPHTQTSLKSNHAILTPKDKRGNTRPDQCHICNFALRAY